MQRIVQNSQNAGYGNSELAQVQTALNQMDSQLRRDLPRPDANSTIASLQTDLNYWKHVWFDSYPAYMEYAQPIRPPDRSPDRQPDRLTRPPPTALTAPRQPYDRSGFRKARAYKAGVEEEPDNYDEANDAEAYAAMADPGDDYDDYQ